MNFVVIYCIEITNYYVRFGFELDKFWIDVQVLENHVVWQEFVGLTEDWAKKFKKKNCPVVEVHFLTKSKKLSLLLRITTSLHYLWSYYGVSLGKIDAWMLIGECSDEDVDVEGFYQFLVVAMIRNYPQAEGIKVHKPSVGSLEEQQYKLP